MLAVVLSTNLADECPGGDGNETRDTRLQIDKLKPEAPSFFKND
jgi:hypothetical protein